MNAIEKASLVISALQELRTRWRDDPALRHPHLGPPDVVPTIVRSLEAGEPTEVDHPPTIADGLTAPRPGRLNFDMIRSAGVRIVTVSEAAIRAAVRELVMTLKVVVEPSAAVAPASSPGTF